MKCNLFVSIFLLFSITSNYLNSQNLKEQVGNYFSILNNYPQEKLYLHLDKPYYAASERIYWKGYLINAISHAPHTGSNFIYVELINNNNQILNKFKIKRKNGSFHGSILLPVNIPIGNYYLRAYTQWMMNAGEEYFYFHKFRVGNLLDRSIQTSIRYEEGNREGYCTVVIRFTNEQNKPLPDIRVENWIVVEQKKEKRYLRKTNANGEIYFDMVNSHGSKSTIEVAFKDSPYQYNKIFQVPLLGNMKHKFALSFFPEGGDLLDGCNQRIAFKAQQSDGNSCELQGYLLNNSGDTISAIRTEHDGMGIIAFTPSANEKYKVIASRDSSLYREFYLPEVKTKGTQLSVYHRKGIIRYNILKARYNQWQDTLYLVGHTRGNYSFFLPLTTDNTSGRFSDSELKEGITELLLVDGTGTVLSRRLVFKSPDIQVNFAIKPFPTLTQQRKLIETPLCITDKTGSPIQTSLSVSLTDRNIVIPDSLANDIRSTFLLTSELKGYIENPGYYFTTESLSTGHHVELLLLTHGWSRFSHANIARPPTIQVDHLMEVKQVITGKATKLLGGKAKKCPVVLIAPKQKISSISYTNEEGRFAFRDIEYCDTVTFVVQARSKAGRATVFLEIDSTAHFQPNNPFLGASEESSKYLEYDQIIHNAYLSGGGMQAIHLQEVTVVASKRDGSIGDYAGVSDSRVSGKRLADLKYVAGNGSAFDLLGKLSGTQVMGNNVRIFGRKHPPIILINEMQCLCEEGVIILNNLDANDIEAFELLKPESSTLYFGKQAKGGAIIVTLKPDAKLRSPSPGLALFTSLGYHESAEFYHPVYQTPEQKENEKSDIRTTVYWNPNLQTDENGKATIRFYTPDNLIDPHLIIEGVSANGHIIRLEK